jgi:hypothetical protein
MVTQRRSVTERSFAARECRALGREGSRRSADSYRELLDGLTSKAAVAAHRYQWRRNDNRPPRRRRPRTRVGGAADCSVAAAVADGSSERTPSPL